MIKKIVLLTAFLILPLLTVTCSDSGKTESANSSVVLKFDGISSLKSIDGIQVTHKSAVNKAMPAGVSSIRIKVYSGTEADGTIFDETLPVTDTITVEVPAGTARIFKLYAFDTAGFLTHSAVSSPVDLIGGENAVIALSLSPATADAVFSVKLLAEDGVSDFADPLYLENSGNKFTADVYKPTINNSDPNNPEVVIGSSNSTVSSSDFVTSLSGLNAYASTPQIVIVRAFTLDGTLAAIGIAAFADLSDGTNSTPIPVVMSRPGKIDIINDLPITSIKVEFYMDAAADYVEVATSGISTGANSVLVSVPNHKTDIGSGNDYMGTRSVRITVNNGTPRYEFTPDPIVIKWKLIDINLIDGTWATHPDQEL